MELNCSLSTKKCVPCTKGGTPLKGNQLISLHNELGSSWQIIKEHHLEKNYIFSNFKEGLSFTNKIGLLAEEEGHHPDILLTYDKVKIQLWTHKIDGLSESDFILAAKCDQIYLR